MSENLNHHRLGENNSGFVPGQGKVQLREKNPGICSNPAGPRLDLLPGVGKKGMDVGDPRKFSFPAGGWSLGPLAANKIGILRQNPQKSTRVEPP